MSKHSPYIRPLDLGSNKLPYTVKVVTDGTRTVAEVYEGDEDPIVNKPVGVGHAVRNKGDRRNPELGVTLAIARAFQDAGENAWEILRAKGLV